MKDAFGIEKGLKMTKFLRPKSKAKPKGLNLGPGRLTSAVNNTNGQPTKWAKGKPADWV